MRRGKSRSNRGCGSPGADAPCAWLGEAAHQAWVDGRLAPALALAQVRRREELEVRHVVALQLAAAAGMGGGATGGGACMGSQSNKRGPSERGASIRAVAEAHGQNGATRQHSAVQVKPCASPVARSLCEWERGMALLRPDALLRGAGAGEPLLASLRLREGDGEEEGRAAQHGTGGTCGKGKSKGPGKHGAAAGRGTPGGSRSRRAVGRGAQRT